MNTKRILRIALMIGLLALSGLATPFFRGPEIMLIMFALSMLYITITGAFLQKEYIIACTVWFIYIGLSFFKYAGDNHFWPFLYFCNLTIACALVRYYGAHLMESFVDGVYLLGLWSLVLFTWQLASLETMLPIWTSFDQSDALYRKPYTHYAHAFGYTIHQFIDVQKGVVRNSGFCWEPGAFSCFVVVALYFQLLRDGFEFKKSRVRYLILIAALLSTQSTTGLAGGFLLLLYAIKSKKGHLGVPGIVLIVALTPVAIGLALPHTEKIESQVSMNLTEQLYAADDNEFERGLGRFQSAVVVYLDFLNNPILGLGANKDAAWLKTQGISANPTSGLGNMLRTFGLFLMIPFLYCLRKSSLFYSDHYQARGKYLFLALVVILGLSFSVLETPVFLALIFFSLFYKPRGAHVVG